MLRFGWVFAVVVVLAQATYELLTGNRLPSFTTEPWDTYLDSSVVQATLGAPSTFAGFLLLTTPFLLWSMERARGPEKLFYIGLLAATVFFASYGGARNSFVALLLEFAIYFVILERRWYVRWAAVACGLVAAVVLVNFFMQTDSKLAEKYQKVAELGLEDRSISQRIALSMNGIWLAIETGGRGVGADGFQETIASGDVLVPLRVDKRGIPRPTHNVWVEILAEYGLVTFLGLMALFAWIARLGWRARRDTGEAQGGGADRGSVGRAVLVGLVGYAFYGVQSGSVLGHTMNWMFLASLCVLAAFLCDASRGQRLAGATAGARAGGSGAASDRSLQLRVTSGARRRSQPHSKGAPSAGNRFHHHR
jgi:O-antigen ligase